MEIFHSSGKCVRLVCVCYVCMYSGISLHLCASPITVVKAVLFISGSRSTPVIHKALLNRVYTLCIDKML